MRALNNMHVSLKFTARADAESGTAELTASFVNPETCQRIQFSDLFELGAAEEWLRDALAECIRARVAAGRVVEP